MEPVSYFQLISATRGTAHGLPDPDDQFNRVTIDSRQVEPGDVFWAIVGEQHDGHDFIAEAEARGAACCIVNAGQPHAGQGPQIAVGDTLQALADFAGWYRLQRDALVIGVTGSVGKTTTREMIYAALSEEHQGICSEKNYNNEVGLPLTLLRLENEHTFAVLELGARKIGDIRKLVEIAQPEIGVITAIAPCHLETFGSLQGILQAKGELFEALPKSGFAILPGDFEVTRSLKSRAACPVIMVGAQSQNQLKATNVEVGLQKLRFKVGNQQYEIAVTGRHYLGPALCAIAVAREIGMKADDIARGLKSFKPVEGRCHVDVLGPWLVIDDTYNASPAAMQAACELLSDLKPADWTLSRRILVVGDMLELGPDSATYHREVGMCAAGSGVDFLLAVGQHAGDVVAGALSAGASKYSVAEFRDVESLCAILDCCLEPSSAVLVKGSRGMKMERVIEWIKKRADEEPPVLEIVPVKKVA